MLTSSLTIALLLSATLCASIPFGQLKITHGQQVNGLPGWCYADAAGHIKAACSSLAGLATGTSSSSSTAIHSTSTTSASVTPSSSSHTSSSSTILNSSAKQQTITPIATHVLSAISGIKLPPLFPNPARFKLDKNKKWSVTYLGNLSFTDKMQSSNLEGDKCRTGQIGDKIIWSCGDMECNGDPYKCGFSGGPAFYGTDNVMVVNTTGVVWVNDNNFMTPWTAGGEKPIPPQKTWGMDTSNVAPINSTHGVAFGFEIWRGASDGSFLNAGNAVASVTLGPKKPIASRVGPLLTGPSEIQLGHQGILRDGIYIYTYSIGGPSVIIVGRVPANDSVFDASKHEFLKHGSKDTWVAGIPTHTTRTIGATTANPGGQFGCGSYGSVFFSDYMKKYVMVCGIDLSFVSMYLSDTAYGPWSAEYQLMSHTQDAHVLGSYGTMVHPEYGNTNEVYMSMGPNNKFNMFKIRFEY